MNSLRLFIGVLAVTVCLVAAEDVGIVAETCAEAQTCGECLAGGCAWQPGADGTDTNCLSDCLMGGDDTAAFLRRCYSGSAKTCPKSQAVCSGKTNCEDCTAAGCRFTEGVCQPECNFADMGEVLGLCAWSVADCAVKDEQAVDIVPAVDATGCGQYVGDCSTCLAEGCVYVPANGGVCKSECEFEDDSCVADTGCPNSVLKDTRTEALADLPALEVPKGPEPEEPTQPVAALSEEESLDSAAGTATPWLLLVQLCAALVAVHVFAS